MKVEAGEVQVGIGITPVETKEGLRVSARAPEARAKLCDKETVVL